MEKLDRETAELERKLGFKNDAGRRKRNNQQTDKEGFGIGFMDFLDGVEKHAKMERKLFKPPKEYTFNNLEDDVAISEGALEAQESDSDQEFSDM